MIDRERVIKGLACCIESYDKGFCPDECEYRGTYPRGTYPDCEQGLMREARELLKAPEIIRCAECKYWHINCMENAGRHGCDVIGDYTGPDYYCASAERR